MHVSSGSSNVSVRFAQRTNIFWKFDEDYQVKWLTLSPSYFQCVCSQQGMLVLQHGSRIWPCAVLSTTRCWRGRCDSWERASRKESSKLSSVVVKIIPSGHRAVAAGRKVRRPIVCAWVSWTDLPFPCPCWWFRRSSTVVFYHSIEFRCWLASVTVPLPREEQGSSKATRAFLSRVHVTRK